MKFIILFEDALDADPGIRKQHMREHLDFLEANSDAIEAAGPLSDGSGKGRDGLWIVDTQTAGQAEALVYEDPFWPTGLRKSFSVIEWTQVYVNGQRRIDPGGGNPPPMQN